MVYKLDDEIIGFPDPRMIPEDKREPSGIIAIGGDLSPDRLLVAYTNGIFPWTDIKADMHHWYCPMERFVIFPSEIHVSHSMRNLFNKGEYQVTIDVDFASVIRHCSEPRIHEEGAWLGEEMIQSFTKLHEMGYAHSVEVWDKDEKLVGGLYGLWVNSCFIGESMFSLVPSGSKIALICLAWHMEKIGGKFIDCQMETPHLKSMGGRYISYDEYMDLMGA
ncbi:MAG: leucyl/phenylalanyl-tRNA--protein transferase [Bacteroidia bacterium]|nr:leucyl/phenylalanyl-tRNA--protein transferase [Bacteroidia bacterium]